MADNMRRRMDLVLGKKVSGIPETKALLASKSRGTTNAPCYRCITSKVILAKCTVSQYRTSQHWVDSFEGYFGGDPDSKEHLKQGLILTLCPVEIALQVSTAHPTLDVILVFQREQMHNLLYGNSPLINKCLVSVLREGNRTTSAVKTKKKKCVLFNQFNNGFCQLVTSFWNVLGINLWIRKACQLYIAKKIWYAKRICE